ncbi:MAG: PLP-dependent aminotransferase family protein [Thermoleophilia bacterium]
MPKYSSSEQIADALREMIPRLPAGGRLPPTRRVAADWGASPVTVQRAIRRLVGEGLVETRPGAGNFVRHARPAPRADYGWQTTALGPARSDPGAIGSTMAPTPDGAISLNDSYPAEDLLPARAVRAALTRATRSRAAVERPPAAGLPDLREWFARELAQAAPPDGNAPTGSDVVVVPGGQAALAAIFRALAAPGEAVVMESPTFWGAIAAARHAGLRIVPVARRGDAVPADALAEALEAGRARLFYAQPHLVNPSGETWSTAEGDEALEVVRAHGAFMIEDDWGHDLAFDGPTVPVATRDRDGHVIYIRSLTKSVSPSIRVAAVIARGPVRTRILTDRTIDEMYVSGVLQAAALEVLTAHGRDAHLRATREQLRARRDALAGHIRRLLPEGTLGRLPRGGLNLWLQLPPGTGARDVAERCARRGLYVSPGEEWFPAEPTGPFLRLNYSGPYAARFEEAVGIVATAIAQG